MRERKDLGKPFDRPRIERDGDVHSADRQHRSPRDIRDDVPQPRRAENEAAEEGTECVARCADERHEGNDERHLRPWQIEAEEWRRNEEGSEGAQDTVGPRPSAPSRKDDDWARRASNEQWEW